MSIKYEDKDIVGTINNIDDANISEDTVYSSRKIDDICTYFSGQRNTLEKATRGVKDMVGTYAELESYDTLTLLSQDIIGVISDETHGYSHSYYEWQGRDFMYIGDVGTSYTQTEFNTKIDEKEYKLVNGVTIKTINGENVLGQGNLDIKADLDTYYPVGYIWQTISTLNPADIFGGTWEKLHDLSLLGSSDKYNVGATGGERTHLLTVDEIAAHKHTMMSHNHIGSFDSALPYSITASITAKSTTGIPVARSVTSLHSDGNYDDMRMYKGSSYVWFYDVDWCVVYNGSSVKYGTVTVNSTTSVLEPMPNITVEPHNNLPSVFTVHMWKRTA